MILRRWGGMKMDSNKKIVVIYKSKYGSTKKYAEWIAKSVNGELIENKNIKGDVLSKYDTIVYGGGLYGGGIAGVKLIKNNIDKLNDKKVIVFAVGTAPEKEEHIQRFMKNNFDDEMKAKLNIFFLRGAMDFSKLTLIHKLMMSMFKRVIKKKGEDKLTEDDKRLLDSYVNPVDYTDKKNITAIVEFVKK